MHIYPLLIKQTNKKTCRHMQSQMTSGSLLQVFQPSTMKPSELLETCSQYCNPSFLFIYSRSISHAYHISTSSRSLTSTLVAASASPCFSNISLPPPAFCLFSMNSSLHCWMAGCYDSMLLLTVFGLGGQGNTHIQTLHSARTYTRTLTSSSLELPLYMSVLTHAQTHAGPWSLMCIWHQLLQMELIPSLPVAIFWLFTQDCSISAHC